MLIRRGHTVLLTGGVDSLHGSAGWNSAWQADGSVKHTYTPQVLILVLYRNCAKLYSCEFFESSLR